MALIMRYFTEFGSFRAQCKKWLKVVVKKFTFAISSPDGFILMHCRPKSHLIWIVLMRLIPANSGGQTNDQYALLTGFQLAAMLHYYIRCLLSINKSEDSFSLLHRPTVATLLINVFLVKELLIFGIGFMLILLIFGRPFVKQFALCNRTVVCLSVSCL